MSIREKIETIGLEILSRPGRASKFREEIMAEAGVGSETKVLDMATAVGGMAFAAREKTPYVTAIDASEERVGIAKNDPRADEIDFRVMDAADTGFADKEFDVTLIVLGLHEMTVEGAKKALIEARRVSNRLVVTEFGLDEWPLFWSFLRYMMAIIEPAGFLKFSRYNVAGLIEDAGWTIEKKRKSFPFTTYVCT